MKNKTYNIQNTLKFLEKYNEMNLLIQSEAKEFDIIFANKYNPHLLGLPYITERKDMNGIKLYNYIFENNLSDQEILNRIEKNHGTDMKENVINRIETFPDFLKNLENGIIVEKTLATKMNVNYLIIQNKDDEFYHLGILSGSNGALLVDFENVEDKREKDLLKTYFVESNKEYFKGSNIAEIVKSIEKYDEKEKEYVPFSFDDEKNKSLLKKYYSDKKEKAKEFLEEYLQRKGINTKELFRCISPNHEDKNPSMSFYAKKNKCTCFACGKNYDIFDLVKMEYGLKTFPEQLRKVEEFMKNPDLIEDVNKTIYSKKNISIELGNNIEKNKSISNKKSVLDPNNPNDIERIIKYQNYIKYCMSNLKECDYLTKRGISEKIQKEYHIGYDPNFKYASFNKAIIIPTYYGCLTARNIDDSSKDRLRKLGNAQIFHYDRIKENPGKEFYIVEGEIDALSIAEAGKKAIALGSVNEINLLVNKLKEDKFENKFILMLDNDEIGKKTQEMLYTKLKEIGINVEKSDILGKYKDPNEFLMKDREKFLSLFQEKEKENPWKKKLNNEKSNGIER